MLYSIYIYRIIRATIKKDNYEAVFELEIHPVDITFGVAAMFLLIVAILITYVI